jgi:hypothetical protein
MLSPALGLVKDSWYWQHQCEGLALFATPGDFHSYRLPLEFEELVVVGNRFHLKPLLPMLTCDGSFYVLALSQGSIRLLHGTRNTVGEVELKGVPRSLDEALRYDEFERSLQLHTATTPAAGGAARGTIFHGQGAGADEAKLKKYILRFFHQLDKAVCECLAGERAPLVLAGVEFIRALYREADHYQHLADEDIDGNPNRLSAEELHRRGWETVAPLFEKCRREAVDRYNRLVGSGDNRAASDIESIVPAAYYRRIETLFVPIGQRFWGFFNPQDNEVQVDSERKPGDEDLLNFALIHTLRNKGTVYAVPPKEMPAGAAIAAMFFS